MKNRKDTVRTRIIRKRGLDPTIREAMDEFFADERLIRDGTAILSQGVNEDHLVCLDPAHRNHPKGVRFKVKL